MRKGSVENDSAQSLAQTDSWWSGGDHLVHLARFSPKAEFAGLNVSGHTLGRGTDQCELPIVNRSCPVHGDMIDPAPFHHVNQELSHSRPEDMGAHHENACSVLTSSVE